ncbi:hypothetical protein [Pseudorhizobium banfieldiae]|nr:hypothetical protein [Pseudorhizobium banfieldiae]
MALLGLGNFTLKDHGLTASSAGVKEQTGDVLSTTEQMILIRSLN